MSSEVRLPLAALCAALFLLCPRAQAQVTQPSREEIKQPEKKEQEPRENEEEKRRQDERDKRKDSAAAAQPTPAAQPEAPSTEEKKDEKKEEKWSVASPGGPRSDVAIDTDEGTWLSVDVSPQGDEIVFDLLGDIYAIPIGGGEARALTTGVEWDMQPRYSPDGRSIAFTSDRAGGDNIWIMNRDGSSPKQVSKEKFRLLNSPAWTPDGSYIVARKHFTSARSLGAGEMWLYHRSGGDGLQLTKRPNDQKDAGEPAFSPDGRYLYFSQDTTPGKVFEYNKDPNRQIYVIQRLDRDTGEIEEYVTGPGGSIRPVPSPDGKQLAFVRRVRGKSVLYVMNLDSGMERSIYNGLDRDMQETWAIHGVYPSMAWTPDNRSIVFWAGGKIQRVDIASKQVRNIPFRVRGTRSVAEALRFRVDVAPSEFPVRMLRWVSVAPNDKQVVYQALGHLYIRDLPDGIPRRLTRQDDHFENYPSFSRDGRWIVYTTWSDDEFGSVRIVPARGGEGSAITRKPGHYVEPVFSPDGTKVVYRIAAPDDLLNPAWSREPGIYAIPATGGTPTRITPNGVSPQFGSASDRVYFLSIEDEDKRALKSIEMDGSDPRTHLMSEEATDFRLSPDEKWVAFTELYNAYITPFIRTGKAVDVGPEAKAVPVRRVSRDAGEFLHWSGDSSRLYWSLGPELFVRDLKEAFSFIEGAPEKLPDAPERGTDIGFRARADVPSGRIAFTGGRVVTMRGDEVIEDGVVLVDGNRITGVGRRGALTIPAGTRTIDASGKTIMPGIIDAHWHGSMGSNQVVPQQSWVNFSSLAFGVTTIHDPSNNTGEIFAASEMERAGAIIGPRIFSTGRILYGAKSPYRVVIDGLDDARSHLRRMKAIGAFSVKSYNQPRREQRQQIVQAARELEMMVVPEGGSLFEMNMSMVADGHTGIEHSIPVANIYKDVLQFWPKTASGYTPTLVVGFGGLWGENYWYQNTNVWENSRLLSFVPRRNVDARARRVIHAAPDEFNHLNNARIARQLNDAGTSVQIGAHGQREGLGAHWELWMLGQGGMTPMQALRAATLNGARYLGMDQDLGSIEPGKLADLIVLDRNPLEDLRNSESIRYTMINGRLFEAMTMNEVGNRPKARRPFFFESDGNEGWSPAMSVTTHQD